MAMDPQTIALHEAGHAVMQWFVGWEADLQFVQMQRVDGGVEKSFMKTSIPNRKTYSDIQVARKKLLVLLAGAATTDDPAAQHNRSDFDEACFVLRFLFDCPIKWIAGAGVAVEQNGPNDLLQNANATCKDILHDASIQSAVEAVSKRLLAAECNEEGICSVRKDDIVAICQRECGDMRKDNAWFAWLA